MSRPGAALVAEVRSRAGGRCEYCRSPEAHAVIGFEVEHIIPVKHGGATTPANLALACFYCNRYKGPNVAGIAATGGVVTRLFHPRLDVWEEHFAWAGSSLIPRSDIGAVTITVLRINLPNAVAVREIQMGAGLW